jgi:hypothetical protein
MLAPICGCFFFFSYACPRTTKMLLDSKVRAKITIMLEIKKVSKSFLSHIGNIKYQARKDFRPPSAMKGNGYFQNLRFFLRNCLETFWIFGNFLGGIFGGIFWRNFLGEIFWEDFFGRIFLGGFFWEDFLRGILWEELLSRN